MLKSLCWSVSIEKIGVGKLFLFIAGVVYKYRLQSELLNY